MYYQENACIYPDLSPKNMTGVKKKKKNLKKVACCFQREEALC
jgi:hypothetical protein